MRGLVKHFDHEAVWDGAEPSSLGCPRDPRELVELSRMLDFLPQMVWASFPGQQRREYYNPRWLEFTGRTSKAGCGKAWRSATWR